MIDILTIVISILALAVSVLSAIFSYRLQSLAVRLQSLDSRKSSREQLNSVINQLIKLNAENNAMWQVPLESRNLSYYQASSTVTQTAVSLSRQAVYLAEQLKDLVTDVEFITIAQGLVMAGDTLLADRYYARSIQSAPSQYYKVINMRAYADFLFNQGKLERGRDFYGSALREFGYNTDSEKMINAYTCQLWMGSEANQRMWQEAEKQYIRAKSILETVSNPLAKENVLMSLNRSHEVAFKPNSQSVTLPSNPDLSQSHKQS